jgi:hypothetical protein
MLHRAHQQFWLRGSEYLADRWGGVSCSSFPVEPLSDYYFNDLTFMPLRVIWRSVRKSLSPLLWMPVFVVFLYRKATGRRPPASYGITRPESLPEISRNDVPDAILTSMRPLAAICESAGFSHVAFLKSEHIGTKAEGYVEVLLDRTGHTYAVIAWVCAHSGNLSHTQVLLICHSVHVDGTKLETCAVRRDLPFDMLSPSYQMLNLGPDIEPSEVIRGHLQRIDAEHMLVRFDPYSLRKQLLANMQREFEYKMDKGYLRPLTGEEVSRLLGGAPS